MQYLNGFSGNIGVEIEFALIVKPRTNYNEGYGQDG